MELKHCPDCGDKVSTTAEICIHCGRPFRVRQSETLSKVVLFLLKWVGLCIVCWWVAWGLMSL